MKALRTLILVCIATVLTVPRDFLLPLLQLPSLIEHYEHHLREHEPVAFADFMWQQLAGEDNHSTHHAQDHTPYSHQHSTECFQLSVFADLGNGHFLSPRPVVLGKNKLPVQDDFAPSRYTASIWQPPKIG